VGPLFLFGLQNNFVNNAQTVSLRNMPGLFKLRCTFHAQGCSQRFRSQAGRTNHVRTFHVNPNVVTTPNVPIPPPDDRLDSDLEIPNSCNVGPSLSAGSPAPNPDLPIEPPFSRKPIRNYHPHLTGTLTILLLYEND
jgi:hypothetical protein